MASVSYQIIEGSDKNSAPIYARLFIGRGRAVKRNTGYRTNPKLWRSDKQIVRGASEEVKKLNNNLIKLKASIEDACMSSTEANEFIDGSWLKKAITLYKGGKSQEEIDKDVLADQITMYLELNSGLKKGSVTSLENVKEKVIRFGKERKGGGKVRVSEVAQQFKEDLAAWMKEQHYSDGMIHKTYAKIRTVCLASEGVSLHPYFNNTKAKSGSRPKRKHMQILSLSDLDLINEAVMPSPALANAQKWLILGCFLGQRVSDLLKINEKQIEVLESGNRVLRLTQKRQAKV